ncbi:Rv1733c family protein [Mycobacteroides saopaulense]
MNALPFGYWYSLFTHLFRKHPLIRGCDRVDAAARLMGCLAAIAMLSVAGAIGTAVHDATLRTHEEQVRTRHEVEAVATEKSHVTGRRHSDTVFVPAQWTSDGVPRRDTVTYGTSLAAGERLSIWVDSSGRHVDAPLARETATSRAIGAAVLSWVACVVFVLALVSFVGRRIDKTRARQWDTEFKALTEHDGHKNSDH